MLTVVGVISGSTVRPRADSYIGYHGLFVPNTRHRHTIVPRQRHQPTAEHVPITNIAPTTPIIWMARLKRGYDIDLSQWPNCGARLRAIGEETDPNVIAPIVAHAQVRGPGHHGARAPPV